MNDKQKIKEIKKYCKAQIAICEIEIKNYQPWDDREQYYELKSIVATLQNVLDIINGDFKWVMLLVN